MLPSVTIFASIFIHGAVCCAGLTKGGNLVPEFMGFLQHHIISTAALEKLEYQVWNEEFGKLWHISSAVDLPDWLRLNRSSSTLYGTPEMSDRGQTTTDFTVQSSISQLTCDENLTVNLTVIVTDTRKMSNKGDCSISPTLVAPVNEIKATVGRPLVIPICQVFQATQDLMLGITLPFGEPVGEDFWLRLDSSTQCLYGVPLLDDIPSPDAVSLVAKDSCGHKVKDAMKMNVKGPDLTDISHTFKMTLDPALIEMFSRRQDLSSFLIGLLDRLETWLELPNMVFFVRINPTTATISWTLMDEFRTVCDKKFLYDVLDKVVQQDNVIEPDFQCFLGPLYPIMSLSLNITKTCSYNLPVLAYQVKRSSYKSSFDHWLEVVLPCAVFVLVVALVVVVFMICSNRYPGSRKKYVLRSEEGTYLEERKPVIFPNESRVKDTTLGPRSPIMLAEASGENETGLDGSTPSLIVRGTSNPPDYHIEDVGVPPPYRLPPPYHSSHSDW